MKKHLLYGTLGSKDTFVPQAHNHTQNTAFPLLTGSSGLAYGIGAAIADLKALNVYPTELGLDFLVLAAHVYAADTRISRKSESQDSWTREIALVIPVSAPDAWSSVRPEIENQLRFLTGDIWEVTFRPRPEEYQTLLSIPESEPNYTKVQLFSGGLDSLIGAIDCLESGQQPLLISHAGDGATSDAQNTCFEALKAHYQTTKFDRLRLWMNIPHKIVQGVGTEDTTRGRSFLFFAIGIFAGTGLKAPLILHTPENGLIALNVPLDVLRLGSLSTHTTHPYYMGLWNTILKKIGISGVIENPYWDLTKGEMVQQCLNPHLLEQLVPSSLSCSSPTKGRWHGRGVEHCGYCLPCLIRRASLQSFNDNTTYTLNDLSAREIDTAQAEGQQIRSFQLAIDRIKKNSGISRLLVHKSGPLPIDPDIRSRLSSVYERGMLEVDQILRNVTAKPLQ